MSWLALDTSTDIASFALKHNGQVYSQEQAGVAMHAQTALVHIEHLLQQAEIKLSDLSGIILGQGPGSFTGLRVASSIAKGLVFPWNIPVYPLNNLYHIAYMAKKVYPEYPVLSVMDARMQQVYWAYYPNLSHETVSHVSCMSAIAKTDAKPCVLAGFNYHEYRSLLPHHVVIAHELQLRPSAREMIEMVELGLAQSFLAADIEPVYIRDQVT
jgi:tRNA threonylcarbamoyladenosine biosynthesis protein TsaB